MLSALIMAFFGWLPAGLWIPVCAVIAVAFLSILIKILVVVFDFIFKFIDLFIPF